MRSIPIEFASRNKGEGVLVEPRFYFDKYDTSGNSDLAAFTNGEEFPVRLTRMTACVMPTTYRIEVEGEGGDEEIAGAIIPSQWAIANATLRISRLDEFYMHEVPLPPHAWNNTPIAAAQSTTRGTVVHRFDQPVVLAARDVLYAEFLPFDAGGETSWLLPGQSVPTAFSADYDASDLGRMVTAQFAGYGMRTGRPYTFGGTAQLTDGSYLVDPAAMQNGGSEAVALTQVTISVNHPALLGGGILGYVNPALWSARIRIVGSGTQQPWFKGPVTPTAIPFMPLPLLGTLAGTAIVHTFPGDGLTLEPGDSVQIEGVPASTPVDDGDGVVLVPLPTFVAFSGYLMVT